MPTDIPLKQFHISNGAKMLPFADYNMPINYNSGIINEHKHVRKNSGIFDVSHMGQILIKISEYNIKNLEKYIPLNLKDLNVNRSNYSFLLNKKGGIIDDIIISKINIENLSFFYIVYNSIRKKQDEKIFYEINQEINILKNNCLFSIQGPESFNVLSKLISIPKNMKFFDIFLNNYMDKNIIISRSGYTGEDGFEISIPTEIAEIFLKNLIKEEKVILCGLGSRDSLRLEAGLSLYGHELNENISPIKAGLTWALDIDRLKDNNLNGNIELLYQLNNIPSEIKIGIISTNRSMIRGGMTLFDKNKNIVGKVTSGCFSPNLNKSIGIGYIKNEFLKNNDFFCEIRNNMELMQQTELPFIKKKYKKKES